MRVQAFHLGHTYLPEHPVLHDISLDLSPGSLNYLIGPSGSGKSTLMKILLVMSRFKRVKLWSVGGLLPTSPIRPVPIIDVKSALCIKIFASYLLGPQKRMSASLLKRSVARGGHSGRGRMNSYIKLGSVII